ncbi:amidohydrolase [Aliiglaciecola sp. CAU 1673]|uniref:amidohydrolase n=1 Tax=Aliiglaciecola sp. CAU 1673 TaxID=3032595 RepID=UPI0023DBC4DE|nr:amidohydrolase [Aliiglaciecola sp. CAU 1673]MDF2179345.1 amidohydrolase [Aliiglaciecola sp. CAU 1673]
MRLPLIFLGLLVAGFGCTPSHSPDHKSNAADWVIVNAHILTMDPDYPQASAIAFKNGSIVAIGDNSAVADWTGEDTQVISLSGQTVLPGFIDTHIHSIEGALATEACDLEDQPLELSNLQSQIQSCAEKHTEGWLQLINLASAGTTLDRWQLDSFLPHRPLMIISTDAHTAWVNSKALELAGVDADSPSPAQGKIIRNDEGEPTGMLVDAATTLVSQHLPEVDRVTRARLLDKTLQQLVANGITAFLEANADQKSIDTFCDLVAANKLVHKVNLALGSQGSLAKEERTRLDALRKQALDCGIQADTIKLYADGVMEFPTQSAALLSPYLDKDGQPTNRAGDLYLESKGLQRFFRQAMEDDFSIHVHAIGDAAVRQSLDALDAVKEVRGATRFSLTHLQLIAPEDINRFAPLQVLAAMQLYWAQPDTYSVDALQPYLGNERHQRIYPARSLWQHGALITGGSDWNVSTFNPFMAMAVGRDRKAPDERSTASLNVNQGLPLQVLLEAYTRNAAQLLGRDGETGSLQVGKAADLIILDRQLAPDMAGTALAQTQVTHTFIDGRLVYTKPIQ